MSECPHFFLRAPTLRVRPRKRLSRRFLVHNKPSTAGTSEKTRIATGAVELGMAPTSFLHRAHTRLHFCTGRLLDGFPNIPTPRDSRRSATIKEE
jgi:hypothetical protein